MAGNWMYRWGPSERLGWESLLVALLLLLTASDTLRAEEWRLVPAESELFFQTVKAERVTETHRFNGMAGTLDASGRLVVNVDSASVQTGIDVRDERLRELLLCSTAFPTIAVEAAFTSAGIEQFQALPPGATLAESVPLTLTLLGQTTTLSLELLLVRLSPNRMLVTSRVPALLDAGTLGLGAAVEELRRLAGLPSISPIVPVSLTTIWERQADADALAVRAARIREPLPGTSRTAGYFELTNDGQETLRIVGASTPRALRVELHRTVQRGEQLRMERLDEVVLEPGATLRFEPGGRHLMFFGVDAALPTVVPLTLEFRTDTAPALRTQRIELRRFGIDEMLAD